MGEQSLDSLISETYEAAEAASRSAWAIAQRIPPRFKNTDEERKLLQQVVERSQVAALRAQQILGRL